MKRLSGKTAVVTGASKGIGAGIAKGLAAEGAAVVINYASSKGGADRVVADIKAKGGKAIAVQGNVAKPADVKKIFAETKQAFGRLDILVNNAGVYNLLPLEEVTEEDFHRHFNINVLGLLLATQEAAKLFGDAGGSVIYRLCCKRSQSAEYGRLHRDERRGRRGNPRASEGAGCEENSG